MGETKDHAVTGSGSHWLNNGQGRGEAKVKDGVVGAGVLGGSVVERQNYLLRWTLLLRLHRKRHDSAITDRPRRFKKNLPIPTGARNSSQNPQRAA